MDSSRIRLGDFMGQKQDGSTINATVSVSPAGLTTYTFNDPYSMNVNLGTVTGVDINGSANNDRIFLNTSSDNTINAVQGNDTFVVGKSETDLEGNVLKGGVGVNIIQVLGSGTDIDLTGVSFGVAASTGIEAVVASKGQTGESVDLNLNSLMTSTLTDAGQGPGQAFAALIGRDGVVNLTTPQAYTLQGVVDASGAGFDANGDALSTSDTATLAAEVTSIGDAEGSLAKMYAGSGSKTALAAVAGNLSAYVFSNGTKTYTIWTDGTINQSYTNGTTVGALYQPNPAVASKPTFGTIALFNPAGAGSVTVTENAALGTSSLQLNSGPSNATGAIVMKTQVSGTIVHGGNGVNGGDYFGLGGSGGGNILYGTPSGDLFDLGTSTALIDLLHGQGGFNVVRATANGSDVDLTTGNGSAGGQATGIQAVVGADGGSTHTVEVNLNSLSTTTDGAGAKTSVFEALLGSTNDILTLSGGSGTWEQIATFAPTDTLPTHATALTDASELDQVFNGNPASGRAESTMTGTLYELLGAHGVVQRYATVWTDSTIATSFTSPAVKLSQAMAQLQAAPAGGVTVTAAAATASSALLARPSPLTHA
jgi:hypothetical protein